MVDLTKPFDIWMNFNPAICYYQRCIMVPTEEDNLYHCRRHQLLHRCRYVSEHWGPDRDLHHYHGYACPTYFEEGTGETTCKMTGHVLDQGQPQYIARFEQCQNTFNFDESEDLHDYAVSERVDDFAIGKLIDTYNVDALVAKFEWMHSHLLPSLQHILFQLTVNREAKEKTFRSTNSNYYYIALYNVACKYSDNHLAVVDNKYRRYTRFKSFVTAIWKLMKPRHPSKYKENQKQLAEAVVPFPII